MRNRPTTDERRLSSTGFSRLLARLGSNSDEAAAQYERLRATLEKFFDWHGAWPPEECADETLDRLTRKLESEIEIVDVRSYAPRHRAAGAVGVAAPPRDTIQCRPSRDCGFVSAGVSGPGRRTASHLLRSMPGGASGRQPDARPGVLRRRAPGQNRQPPSSRADLRCVRECAPQSRPARSGSSRAVCAHVHHGCRRNRNRRHRAANCRCEAIR